MKKTTVSFLNIQCYLYRQMTNFERTTEKTYNENMNIRMTIPVIAIPTHISVELLILSINPVSEV